jgi:hypothetical protein
MVGGRKDDVWGEKTSKWLLVVLWAVLVLWWSVIGVVLLAASVKAKKRSKRDVAWCC